MIKKYYIVHNYLTKTARSFYSLDTAEANVDQYSRVQEMDYGTEKADASMFDFVLHRHRRNRQENSVIRI